MLLVEDHAPFRQALATALRREVYAQAASLSEGRELCASEGPDAAVVDLGLPDGDGTELVRELRRRHPSRRVPVLTISLDPSCHARALEAGVDVVLLKASPLESIVGAIRAARRGEGKRR